MNDSNTACVPCPHESNGAADTAAVEQVVTSAPGAKRRGGKRRVLVQYFRDGAGRPAGAVAVRMSNAGVVKIGVSRGGAIRRGKSAATHSAMQQAVPLQDFRPSLVCRHAQAVAARMTSVAREVFLGEKPAPTPPAVR